MHMANKPGRVVTNRMEFPSIKLQDHSNTWSWKITWQKKYIISPLPQRLVAPDLAGWLHESQDPLITWFYKVVATQMPKSHGLLLLYHTSVEQDVRKIKSVLWEINDKQPFRYFKDILKNMCKFSARFIEKQLCRSSVYNFIKKETPTRVFSYEFYDIFKNSIFTKHPPTIASDKRNE